jgi:glutathione peroxidase
MITITKIYKIVILLLSLSLVFVSNSVADITIQNAYQFSFEGIDGNKINLSDFKGKVILVVNTASKCGFTTQYQGLENLYKKYKNKGFVVIGIPCADFGNQEFSKSLEIKEFVTKEFHISFPVTKISKVIGDNAHPFYLWANNKSGFFGSPKWNFHKYLIDKNGNIAAWFSSNTDPESKKITSKIEELL